MTPQRAAATLGSFLGLQKDQLKPGDVVDIPQASMLRLLEEASGGIREIRQASEPVTMLERERRRGDRESSSPSSPRPLVPPSSSSLEPVNDLDRALFVHADSVTRRFFGDQVYLRGIVEFSNVCAKDCSYCGIRKFQRGIKRYESREGFDSMVLFFVSFYDLERLNLFFSLPFPLSLSHRPPALLSHSSAGTR